MENSSKAPEMFESLTRPELDALNGKLAHAVESVWNRSKTHGHKDTSIALTGVEIRNIRADVLAESDRRINL